MQKILLIAVCFITLGLATELDFIEHESELQEGFVFGEGWSWIEDIAPVEDFDELILYKSGKSGKSGKSDKSDKSGKSGKSDKSSSDSSSSSSSSSSSGSDSDSDSDTDGKDKVGHNQLQVRDMAFKIFLCYQIGYQMCYQIIHVIARLDSEPMRKRICVT